MAKAAPARAILLLAAPFVQLCQCVCVSVGNFANHFFGCMAIAYRTLA